MFKRIVAVALTTVLIASAPVFSQWPLGESPQTLRPSSAQAVALGLTGASYSEGLFSVASNPAGLAFLKRLEVGFSHYPAMTYYDDHDYLNQEVLGIACRVSNKTALSFNYINIDLHFPSEGFSGLRILGLSAAHLFVHGKHHFSLGATGKYYDERIEDFKANVFWFDVGARYKRAGENNKNFGLGLSLSNFGKDMKTESDFVIAKPLKLLRAGASYQTARIATSNLSLLVTLEYQKSLRKEEFRYYYYYYGWHHLSTGLEARFSEHLFGRIGYSFDLEGSESNPQGFTYGLGFITPEKLSKRIPIVFSLAYGRGLRNSREYDQNAFNIEIRFDY